MAPREDKITPKVQNVKGNTLKKTNISLSTSSMIKKTTSLRKTEQTPRKGNNNELRQKPASTPKPKENKPALNSECVTRSAKKSWKRRPKPAHSGVPVPEKMKRILQQQLQDSDCSF